MFNKHSIQAVAYFAISAAGLASCVGAIFLGIEVLLFFGAAFSGWCFYLGLIQTAKSFVLLKPEEVEDKTWKLRTS